MGHARRKGASHALQQRSSQTPKPPAPTPKAARCGRVTENSKLALACPGGKKIDEIVFASFGTPDGGCPAGFKDGICSKTGKIGSANQSLAVVERARPCPL